MVGELHLSKSVIYGMNVADWEMSDANFHRPISDSSLDKTLSACAGSSPQLESARGASSSLCLPCCMCPWLSPAVAPCSHRRKARRRLVPHRTQPSAVPGRPGLSLQMSPSRAGHVLPRGRVLKLSPGGYLMTVFLPSLPQQRVTDLLRDLARAEVP